MQTQQWKEENNSTDKLTVTALIGSTDLTLRILYTEIHVYAFRKYVSASTYEYVIKHTMNKVTPQGEREQFKCEMKDLKAYHDVAEPCAQALCSVFFFCIGLCQFSL
jgi:hypothetical protein